jgi:hypothetical protein
VLDERLAGEAAVERLHLEAGDIEKPEPFVLGCPPQRAGGAVVERAGSSIVSSRMSPSRRSSSTPASAARARVYSSIAGDESMPMTGRPVACATDHGRHGMSLDDRDPHAIPEQERNCAVAEDSARDRFELVDP